ncbi:hypothetical protein BJY01DRAFT_254256 [Aspergillus pseudoustus]|uniref:VWFA domain-containing protein n=1 Tax=Aspergillus pseudoustus TaxID=1810923 RepID=A0ABR4IWW9_9EURO
MDETPPVRLIGCLLDVSGSMREALEVDRPGTTPVDQRNDRLHTVLRTALKLARAELKEEANSLIFVGVFGLETEKGPPPSVDLGSVVDALLRIEQDSSTGHDRLIELAAGNNLAHVSEYIRTKLSSAKAAIVHDYLRGRPDRISEFVNAIPTQTELNTMKVTTGAAGGTLGLMLGAAIGSVILPVGGTALGASIGGSLGAAGSRVIDDKIIESSEGLVLANRIAGEWFLQFADFVPRPAKDVVDLLQKLHEHSAAAGGSTLLDSVDEYLYGNTPLCHALSQSLGVFRAHKSIPSQLLVLISDGLSTDGDPVPLALRLKEAQVTVATLYLIADKKTPERELYDTPSNRWDTGQQTLFQVSSTLRVSQSPIPVLMSVGWKIPSSGEASLFASVCSSTAVDEFCSLLVSERLGNTDALLDVIGRVNLDEIIDNEQTKTCKNPSDQGDSATCYAHAVAAVAHMALLRIVRKDGTLPDSIDTIRRRILTEFEPGETGQPIELVLKQACEWYNLRYKLVDERGARQAVFRRRPVVATFRLSKKGWAEFSKYFRHPSTCNKVLTRATMRPYRSGPDTGGHAVVLYACDPQSLSFLNSWGKKWGANGTFSIDSAGTLELDGSSQWTRMRFYDVFWYEDDLPLEDREAYRDESDRYFIDKTLQYPAILDLEASCPHCEQNSFLGDFRGTLRSAVCPNCERSFPPQPGYLMQALYARAGLRGVT